MGRVFWVSYEYLVLLRNIFIFDQNLNHFDLFFIFHQNLKNFAYFFIFHQNLNHFAYFFIFDQKLNHFDLFFIFDQNLKHFDQFFIFTKIFILSQFFNFWPTYCFLAKIVFFSRNLWFLTNVFVLFYFWRRLLSKFLIFFLTKFMTFL